jgi:hypothetical protein
MYNKMLSSKDIQRPSPAMIREEKPQLNKKNNYIDDEALLARLGYKQDLSRQLSVFSNFAISFGCCSVLSGLLPVNRSTSYLIYQFII